VAEPGQLAVDSSIAPPAVLAGQPQDKPLDRRSGRWSPVRSAVGVVVPFRGDESTVPGQQRGGVTAKTVRQRYPGISEDSAAN
jgi:hypothetical protein